MTELRSTPINFSIEDIGSDILTRFSDDMYSSESIIRELVKNCSDSYYQLETFCNENGCTFPDYYNPENKEIHISIHSDNLLISDKGIGCDQEAIKKLIKIAISDKDGIEGATGFRGIGFWAAFSAGEKIVIETTKYKSREKCILEIDTKKMRSSIHPNVNIGQIMNDPQNINLQIGETDENEHYTLISIQSKGKPGEHVSEKENRLYDLIHSEKEIQKDFIKKTCTLYFPETHPQIAKIKKFYEDSNLPIFEVYLDEELLKKDFDKITDDFKEKSLYIEVDDGGGFKQKEVAKCWYVRNKVKAALIKSGLKGVRIYKDGYPVGGQNLFSDDRYGDEDLKAKGKLDYYICEVHVLLPELTADANGENFTDGIYKKDFIKSLRAFYLELITEAYYRSAFLNRIKKFSKINSEFEDCNPDKMQELLKEANKIINEYRSNIRGRKGKVDRKNLRNIDRKDKVKKVAQKLIKNIQQASAVCKPTKPKKGSGGESEEKGSKKPDDTTTTYPTADTTSAATNPEVREYIFDKQKLKRKIQQVLLADLNQKIEPDDIKDLIEEIESIFEALE